MVLPSIPHSPFCSKMCGCGPFWGDVANTILSFISTLYLPNVIEFIIANI